MELRPSDDQQQLIEAYTALYAKESPPERVRDAEPLGFDQRLWDLLKEMGSVGMAVPEDAGGWGASLLDIALVAQEHGRALGSAPLIETQVAARLLARVGGDAALDVLTGAIDGERLVTIAPRRVRGDVATMVPAGAVATDAVVFDGTTLSVVSIGDDKVVPENLGSMPLADVPLGGGVEIASGPAAAEAFESAVDDWLALMANAQAGMAQRSLDIGVEYVKGREAFGQAIGGFQAVGHRMADCKAATDGSELIAREAAWAEVADPSRFAQLAAMAYGFCTQTARDTTYWSLHFHGGYGFMLEYDIQLYYRRCRAWARVLMDSGRAYQRVADRRYGDRPAAGRAVPADGGGVPR